MNHPSAVWPARATASSLLIVGSALLGGCYERPPVDTVQTGIRGIGDEQVINPRLDAIKYKKNQIPEPSRRRMPMGRRPRSYSRI